jgi:hypothetical protein
MKAFLSMALLLAVQNCLASEFQLGVVLGAPTGISAKVTLDDTHSIDGTLAYSLADELGLEFHTDYLFEKVLTFSTPSGIPAELYYGIGARFVSIKSGPHDNDVAIGPRVPVGVNYKLKDPRIEFFGELALAFDLVPSTNLDLEGGIGLRYRF